MTNCYWNPVELGQVQGGAKMRLSVIYPPRFLTRKLPRAVDKTGPSRSLAAQ